MKYQRSLIFWIMAAVILAGTVVLLREILLPFLVGIALAYLLDPLVTRLERLGLGRSGVALGIIGLFYVTIIALIIVLTPIFGEEVATFLESSPLTSQDSKGWQTIRAGRGCIRSSARV